ncbi:hypothetical protein chiPu_0010742 [Chiloscyllium punctatum]|uniref:Receptor ligand binding region domain-containing protein n=1 Tax=Chiloscyllium punctatum TaxID=137246 RepID=A0A401SPG9_CHIPU|nr:hypothetical protein [Chiloscyllium punctatum]
MALFLIFLLLAAVPTRGTQGTLCKRRAKHSLPALSEDGDIILGGIFTVHLEAIQNLPSFTIKPPESECRNFHLSSFRLMLTMIYAIEEINRNKNLLPNTTLGYKIYDDCSSSAVASKAALALVTSEEQRMNFTQCEASNVAAIVGCDISTSSIVAARVIGPLGIPMVSYYSTCSCLSDKQEYPTFFRTIPSDNYQSKLLAELVKTFGWKWIGTIRSNIDYGNFGMQAFVEQVRKTGVCIAYSESFYRTDPAEKISKIVQVIKQATTKVVVAFVDTGDMRVLLQEIWRQNVTGIQWIGSEGWVTEQLLPSEESARFLTGTIGVATPRTEIAELRDYLLKVHPSKFGGSILVKEFWEKVFACNLTKHSSVALRMRQCTGMQQLDGLENAYLPAIMDGSSYHVYKAVYAVAHALDDMLNCEEGYGPFRNNTCAHISNFEPWQVRKRVHFILIRSL